jgi:protein-S-isoprenylcysteine O-methyltransferase Ste14
VVDWLRNARLVTRTGAGIVVVGIGLATAVRPTPAAFGVAALLAVAGALIRFWSAGIISKNKELATSGPYAYVRNPLYFGSLLVAVAFFILNGNPWFVVPAAVGAVALYVRTVRSEEEALRGHFGEAFDAYRARVPAIIPWRGRCRMEGGETAYSLDQSLHNKEYNGALGTLALLVAFYAYMHWISVPVFRGAGVVVVAAVVVLRAVRVTRRVRAERAAAQASQAAQAAPPAPDSTEGADAGRAGN